MSTHSITELNHESDSNDSDYQPGNYFFISYYFIYTSIYVIIEANLSSDEDSENDLVESDHNT
jgi:hypothetical protein